jgi:hypothetical protein
MAGIAISCLGAAVFAAPMPVAPKSKVADTAVSQKASFAPLATGPAFQLGRAGRGEDEDCVRVLRMTGPDGRVYVTRGLVCAD